MEIQSLDGLRQLERDLREKHRRLWQDSEGWRPHQRGESYSTAILSDPEIYVVRGIVELSVAAKTAYDYMVTDQFNTIYEWNPISPIGRVVEVFDDGMRVIHCPWIMPFPFSHRDDIFYQLMSQRDDKLFEFSQELPSHPRVVKKTGWVTPRLPFSSKEFTALAAERCRVQVIWQSHPAGAFYSLPRSLVARMVSNNMAGEFRRLQQRFSASPPSSSTPI